jgi:phosphate transport system permease protein
MTIGDATARVDATATIELDDVPRTPDFHPTTGDRVFRGLATAGASMSLLIVGATLWFLIDKSRPAFKHSGIWNFFTKSVWNPAVGNFGVFGLMIGTLIIAAIAMTLAVPFAIGMALFINEYAPKRIRQPLTSVMDLLAALPSLLFGLWGLRVLQAHIVPVSDFISSHLSVVPFLRLKPGDPVVGSSFVAGVVVALMITPIITSVTRDVMAQVPREQCEGALALGGTRWGMIRDVILPYSRSGIIGAALLGFGRAIGETIAVALILSTPLAQANTHILKGGGASIASYIAVHFGEADPLERSGLVAAGLALFLLAFLVNFLARLIVRKTAPS